MLIGISLTLKELEEKMQDKLKEINKEYDQLAGKVMKLEQEIKQIPSYTTDDKGAVISNEVELTKKNDEFRSAFRKLEELNEQIEFINKKLEELDHIEEDSKGAIKKESHVITLSLNDCLLLGVEENDKRRAHQA